MKKNQFSATRTQAASEWQGYTAAPLSVQFCIPPTRRALATFKVCIFNDDYSLLAEAYGTGPEATSSRQRDEDGNLVTRLGFLASGEYCWFPGEYVAVLYQGHEPLCRGCIVLSEVIGAESLADLEFYQRGSVDYLAARDLYQNSVFRNLPFDCGLSLFKQQLSELYAREQGEAVPDTAGVADEEFESEMLRLLELEPTPEERSRRSRNLVVRVIDDHEDSALWSIVRSLPALSHPTVPDFKREVWHVKELVETNAALPAVPQGSTLILSHAEYFLQGGEAGTLMAKSFLAALAQRRYAGNRIVLVGREEAIDCLFSRFDDLLVDFPERNHLTINVGLTLPYFVRQLLRELRAQHFALTDEMVCRITSCLYGRWEKGMRYEASILTNFVTEVKSLHAHRLLQSMDEGEDMDAVIFQLCYDDFEQVLDAYDAQCKAQQAPEAMAKVASFVDMSDCAELCTLNGMVGLERVKAEVRQAVDMARFEALRRHFRLDAGGSGRHHMLFMGNPGTGKTTVAKLVGAIYHRLGLLSSGHTVACDRSTLLGQFIGESEHKVREQLESARGGVLFVDEAYSLFADDKDRDFGRHVINCMLPILSEPDPDMIVIFAGYEGKLTDLFRVNPGLRDRFPLSLHFDDYTSDELLGIIRNLAAQRRFTFTAEAEAEVHRLVKAALAQHDPHFGNGRWATNLFELGILRAMAERVVAELSSARDDEAHRALPVEPEVLSRITADDVRRAEVQYLGAMAPRRAAVQRIGFLTQGA